MSPGFLGWLRLAQPQEALGHLRMSLGLPGGWPCANAGSSKPFKDVARFPGRAGPGGNAGSSRPFKDVARFPLFLCSIRSIIQILIHDSSALLFLNKKYHRSSIS